MCIYSRFLYFSMFVIRRPQPLPRPGRRLGPPEVRILSFLNPCHAQRCRQKPPQGHSNGSRAPHGRSNGFFYKRSRLPFTTPQILQTFQLPQKFAQLRRERYPNKVNTRHARRQKPPQGHSNGFLYAFKGAVCQASNAPNPPKVRPAPQGKGTPTIPTRATPARKSHHKATAMAQEHPTAAAMASFIGVQGCRLPGLKPSKPSNSSKSLPNSAGKRYPNKPNTRNARRQKPPQGHSNGSRAPHDRSNAFL